MENENWILARKPLSEKNIADNVLRWGVGGINIDVSRIELNGDNTSRNVTSNSNIINVINSKNVGTQDDKWKEGRFPANFIYSGDDEVLEEFGKAGNRKGMSGGGGNRPFTNEPKNVVEINSIRNDEGSAARFFYNTKE